MMQGPNVCPLCRRELIDPGLPRGRRMCRTCWDLPGIMRARLPRVLYILEREHGIRITAPPRRRGAIGWLREIVQGRRP